VGRAGALRLAADTAAVRNRAGGVALLSVLLIVALVSALIYDLLERHALVVAQTRQTLYADRALAYALGAEAYARQLLVEDWNDPQTRALDTLTDRWALPGAPFEVEGGTLEIVVRDLDGRFNLNSLSTPGAAAPLDRLKTLLGAAGLDPVIADRWRDWIDPDGESTGFGAEDNYYLGLDRPYRTANRPAATPTELRLVEGVDAEMFHVIEGDVVVLPSQEGRVNVNTATLHALMSLSAQLSAARAQSLIESDRQYTDAQSVAGEVPELNNSLDAMKVTSDFFEVLARADVNGVRADVRCVLHRNPTDGVVTLLARDFGRRFPAPALVEEEEGET
jgi:general secretion pathway protein K